MSGSSKKESYRDSQEFKVPSKFKFQDGEKVLCFHGPLIYEAKCLQSRYDEKEKTPKYHIHYSGWNKSWDEWVPESRVLKYNEANIQKQKDLYKAQKAEPKGKKGKKKVALGKEEGGKEKEPESKGSSTFSSSEKKSSAGSQSTASSQDSSSDVPKRKRPRSDPTVETEQANRVTKKEGSNVPLAKDRRTMFRTEYEEHFLTKVEIKIKLPDELKPWLVDDWELISKNKKLVLLPARVCVDTILDDWIRHKASAKTSSVEKESARVQVADGIKDYFNTMLSAQLLYKIEKKQLAEVSKSHSGMTMSRIYGAIHLLRLFVKLGPALAYTKLDEKTLPLLMAHFQDFLRFLYKNRSTYYDINNDYIPLPIDYMR